MACASAHLASMRKGMSPQRPDLSRTLRSVGWLSTQTVVGIADTGAISSPTLKISTRQAARGFASATIVAREHKQSWSNRGRDLASVRV
jgi:hypothetical protein